MTKVYLARCTPCGVMCGDVHDSFNIQKNIRLFGVFFGAQGTKHPAQFEHYSLREIPLRITDRAKNDCNSLIFYILFPIRSGKLGPMVAQYMLRLTASGAIIVEDSFQTRNRDFR